MVPATVAPQSDVRYEPRTEPADYYPPPRDADGSAVLAPAILLMIVGFLGFIVNTGQAVVYLAAPEFMDKTMERMMGPAFVEKDPAKKDAQRILGSGLSFLFGLLGLFVFIAAIQMARRRTYGLAMAGSILAMVNVGNLCCCLGLPFGIWALIVLARPEVRAAFE
jgi:hypothetical protein